MKIETILVPVDFSDVTPEVVRQAAEFAGACGSRLVLLHVAEPEPDFVGYEAGPPAVRASVAHDLHGAHQQLEALKQTLIPEHLEVLALHIQGPITEKILHEANHQQAGLIVIGSHGHGALHHLLVGSVITTLLKSSPCPVLVVPWKKVEA